MERLQIIGEDDGHGAGERGRRGRGEVCREHCDIRLVRPMRRAGPVSREVVGDDSGVSSDAH